MVIDYMDVLSGGKDKTVIETALARPLISALVLNQIQILAWIILSIETKGKVFCLGIRTLKVLGPGIRKTEVDNGDKHSNIVIYRCFFLLLFCSGYP